MRRKSLNFRMVARPLRAGTQVAALLLGLLPVLGCARTQPTPAASPPPPAPPAQASPAQPAEPPPPVSGKVRSLVDNVLTLATLEHGEVRVTLGTDTRVVVNRPGTLADVNAGAFIGTTAVEGADGKLRASEVHVFPEALRGMGEGHYPWGSAPATTMTNGNVRSMTNGSVAARTPGADAATGVSLDVTYKGGETRVEVAPDVPVVVIALADASLLRPDTQVLAIGQPDGSGGLAASLVAVLPPPPAKQPQTAN